MLGRGTPIRPDGTRSRGDESLALLLAGLLYSNEVGLPSFIVALKTYGKHMHVRATSGCTDLPGYGFVHWMAQELTLPDGSVFATVLVSAMASDGTSLNEAGRDELAFWESMIG